MFTAHHIPSNVRFFACCEILKTNKERTKVIFYKRKNTDVITDIGRPTSQLCEDFCFLVKRMSQKKALPGEARKQTPVCCYDRHKTPVVLCPRVKITLISG